MIIPVPRSTTELGSGIGGAADTVTSKLASSPVFIVIFSTPDNANEAPVRVKVVGVDAPEQADSGGAAPKLQGPATAGVPVPGTRLFVLSPYPVNVCRSPAAATVVPVPDWLDDRVRGVPAGSV